MVESLFGEGSPFVNSDVLIKAHVKKNKKAKSRLKREEKKLDSNNGERFIINDLVLNDVLVAAQEKKIPLMNIIDELHNPAASYFLFIASEDIVANAVRDRTRLREHCLTITDWVTLRYMRDLGGKILISDKREIDDVLEHKDFAKDFKGIRRV